MLAAWQRFQGYMPDSTPEEILIPFMVNFSNRNRPFDAHYGVLRWDRLPALQAISNRKILVVQAERDTFVGDQESLMKLLSNAKRTVLKDAGVFMFYERPAESAQLIIEFLQD